MNTRIIALFLLLLSFSSKGLAEVSDSIVVERLLASGDTTTLYYARQLLGKPYVGQTLEVNDKEQLVVNLRQLDCTTLVETVCALTMTAREGKRDFHSFCHHLQQLRYRQGKLYGYPSRLHYFSDWIEDNAAMGLVEEITSERPPFTAIQKLNLNYMSMHPQAYKALRQHPEMVKQIAAQEKNLTGRQYRYIPKDNKPDNRLLRQFIHDGDILAITCSKPGLDIAHLGFAVWRKDGLHLFNASQIHKKVVEEPMTLWQYLAKHPSHTGIRVIRLTPVLPRCRQSACSQCRAKGN
ncbi:MAG: DUF1460 domain-containing protein [Prevotella sp.]|nr:DUF1460 domain-containing protein [Prevotella sp.]